MLISYCIFCFINVLQGVLLPGNQRLVARNLTRFRTGPNGIFIDTDEYPTATEIRPCVMFSDSSGGGGGLKIRIRRTDRAGGTIFLEEIRIVLSRPGTLGVKILYGSRHRFMNIPGLWPWVVRFWFSHVFKQSSEAQWSLQRKLKQKNHDFPVPSHALHVWDGLIYSDCDTWWGWLWIDVEWQWPVPCQVWRVALGEDDLLWIQLGQHLPSWRHLARQSARFWKCSWKKWVKPHWASQLHKLQYIIKFTSWLSLLKCYNCYIYAGGSFLSFCEGHFFFVLLVLLVVLVQNFWTFGPPGPLSCILVLWLK